VLEGKGLAVHGVSRQGLAAVAAGASVYRSAK